MKYQILSFIIVFIVTSCGPKVIYSHKVNIPLKWKYNEEICFEYQISNRSSPYDLRLCLVHTAEYDYENMYVNVTTIFPTGKKTTNPVSLQLANSDGTWQGNCSGDLCTVEIEMSTKAFFENIGKYTLCFTQYSRKDSLEGLVSMELKVVESLK
ncbi:MAG: gliding motility lipoprotein GldH [Saprospiraceae bacterium]|nr:gliding motility lipoprotein GldH [Saprospiraceae bacterium]